jgi:Zn-dependent M28 family amino/carboxypeptidase
VAQLYASGDHDKVEAMLDMDMIGYTEDSDLDCLLETESWAEDLAFAFSDAATQYTSLRIEFLWGAWGSDHVPYLETGIPALLTIENDFWSYPFYHTTNDLPEHITIEMGEEILKMNVAAMAEMVGAETIFVFLDDFESGDLSAWSSVVP